MKLKTTQKFYINVFCFFLLIIIASSSFVGAAELSTTDSVKKEIVLKAAELHPPIVGNPELIEIGIFSVALFGAATDESMYTEFHVPLDYIDGSNISVHFHWAPTTAVIGNVTWGIEWLAITDDSNETLGTGTIQIVIDATQGLTNELLGSEGIVIPGTGIVRKDIIGIRFFRDADASEPGASDTYASDAALVIVAVEIDRGIWDIGYNDKWFYFYLTCLFLAVILFATGYKTENSLLTLLSGFIILAFAIVFVSEGYPTLETGLMNISIILVSFGVGLYITIQSTLNLLGEGL